MTIHKNPYLILAFAVTFLTALIEFLGRGFAHVILPYAVIIPLIIILYKVIFSKIENLKEGWSTAVDKMVFFIILINAPGSLFLHDIPFQYDRFLHFSMGFIVFQILVLIFLVFPSSSEKRVIIFSALITFFSLFLFEGYQYLTDVIFGTHLFFDVEQNIVRDFWEDIVFGSTGLILSIIYIKNKYSETIHLVGK